MKYYRIEALVESDLSDEKIAELVEGREFVFGSRVVDGSVYEVTHMPGHGRE